MTEAIDFDKEFGFAKAKRAPTILVTMFEREWHLLSTLNNFTFTRMAGGDTASIGEFIYNAVIPEERADWQRALTAIEGFDTEQLMEFTRRLVEVVGNGPTKSPSASRSSASKPTRARKSTVVSS